MIIDLFGFPFGIPNIKTKQKQMILRVVTAIFTGIGIYGVGIQTPKKLEKLWKGEQWYNKLMQYFLVFVLIMQGGGEMSIWLSVIITLLFVLINESMLAAEKAEGVE